MDERQEYRLNVIMQQDTISILNKDYYHFSPPYLTEFCTEIKAVLDENNESMEQILAKTAQRFKETAYTEYNFPYTYREDAEIVVTSADFFQYKETYCKEITPAEKVIMCTMFLALFTTLFMLMRY